MRVLVCGGRDYRNRDRLFEALDRLHARAPITEVVHGCASGADMLAHWWAQRHDGVGISTFPADWVKHGRSAGPLRNQAMLDQRQPDVVVAFPGGNGTDDMVRRALKAGVRVLRIS